MRILFLSALLLLFSDCASLRGSSQKTSRSGSAYIKRNSTVAVLPPTVDSTQTAVLTSFGWSVERYTRELKREIAFLLSKRKVKVVSDSGVAKVSLRFHLCDCRAGAGSLKLEGYAILVSERGSRRIEVTRRLFENQAVAGEVAATDKIRYIASQLVKKAMTIPKPEDEQKYKTQIWMML